MAEHTAPPHRAPPIVWQDPPPPPARPRPRPDPRGVVTLAHADRWPAWGTGEDMTPSGPRPRREGFEATARRVDGVATLYVRRPAEPEAGS